MQPNILHNNQNSTAKTKFKFGFENKMKTLKKISHAIGWCRNSGIV